MSTMTVGTHPPYRAGQFPRPVRSGPYATHAPQLARRPLGGLQRRALIVAGAIPVFLLPWCVVLAHTLSSVTTVSHWSLAWIGLDAAEGAAAALTAWLIRRRDPRSALTATLGAALLLADAWFDMCTSAPAGFALNEAVLEAVFVEVPLAGAALYYATRTLASVKRAPNGPNVGGAYT